MTSKKSKTTDGDAAVLEKIDAMPEPYRAIGKRLHALILSGEPALSPRVWYGMPGYAKDGPVLCFFRVDDGFVTFGLTEKANHARSAGATDRLMACAWFLTTLDDATESRLSDIVRQAAS